MISSVTPYVVAVTPAALAILAQAEVPTVAQYGLLGGVLAWLMIRVEKLLTKSTERMERIEHKIVGMNKTMLIWLLEAPTTGTTAKRVCREEIRKLDPHLADEIAGE